LTTITTGGIVADASGAFRAGASVFSGTFLPGVRAIVLNNDAINRLRSNLVAQTLQETIQVPSKGSTTTIVLLPRAGILSFTDAQVSVMIKRVIDVHLVEEVVTPVTQTPIKKNECTVGNSRDQTRQALGEPTSSTTNDDGSSSFTYSVGPVPTVNFDKNGTVTSCGKPRTATEQLSLAKTLVAFKQTLTDLGLTGTSIALTDQGTVVVDIPGVSQTFHFDGKGARASDFTFSFSAITAEKSSKKGDFDNFLKAKALSTSVAKAIAGDASGATTTGKPDVPIRYHSPDVDGGFVMVTFKLASGSKKIDDNSTVSQIAFEGPEPKNLK
jgi:hypothetical protein